jgi:transposase
MASAYSQDLRDRVIDAVVRGEMSRRAAAARFGVSESSAIK